MKRFLAAAFLILSGVAAQAQTGLCPQGTINTRVDLGPTIGNVCVPVRSYVAGINAQTGTTYTVAAPSASNPAGDAGKLVTFSNAAAVAVTLPQAGTPGFEANKIFYFINKGQSLVTITPTTSNIGGLSAVPLANGVGITLISDGTNYQVEGNIIGGKGCTASGATPQTCNGAYGVVTTDSQTTAARTAATAYVINNSNVAATSEVGCTIGTYSGTMVTNGTPIIGKCAPGAGTITVTLVNVDTTNALSGTIGIHFDVRN